VREVNLVSLYYARFRRLTTNWGFAFLAWIGSGLYIFVATKGGSLFSWQWLVFFLLGTPAATLIFGTASCRIIQMLGSVKLQGHPWGPPAIEVDVVLVIEAVVIFLTARWVLQQML
jgi:hypothetical protein